MPTTCYKTETVTSESVLNCRIQLLFPSLKTELQDFSCCLLTVGLDHFNSIWRKKVHHLTQKAIDFYEKYVMCSHVQGGKKKQCVKTWKDGNYWLQLIVWVESSWPKIPGSSPEISFQVNKASKRLWLAKRTVTTLSNIHLLRCT